MAIKLTDYLNLIKRFVDPNRRRLEEKFLRHVETLARDEIAGFQRITQFGDGTKPLLSLIVPVFNTKPEYLRELVQSFPKNQKFLSVLEFIFVDDGSTRTETKLFLKREITLSSMRIIYLETNSGPSVAQTRGLALARGRYAAIVDHDDRFSAFGLEMVIMALMKSPQCKILYTDEVLVNDRGRLLGLFLKPAWDRVLLSGVNYVNHLTVFAVDLAREMGSFDSAYDGSHDYEFLLRIAKTVSDNEIVHLPYPSYQWRIHSKSLSQIKKNIAIANARKAIATHFSCYSTVTTPIAMVEAKLPDLHRPLFPVGKSNRVSVIMPMRDKVALTQIAVEGVLNKNRHKNLELIIIDNGSEDPQTARFLEQIVRQDRRVSIIRDDGQFNFSRLINRGAQLARGDTLLILNNDIEVTDPEWMEEILQCFQYKDIGIVGIKLLYPSRRIQHAGVIVGFGGLAGHWYEGEATDFPGPMGRLAVRQSLSAVTGACMAVSRQCFDRVGGFNEVNFEVAYNDVDFCLRARSLGFNIIWTPFAELIHHESATRGSDVTPQNLPRFKREQDALQSIHATASYQDPAINPWFSRDRSHPQPILLEQLTKPRTNRFHSQRPIPVLFQE